MAPREGTLDKVREELAELLAAESLDERREELGDLLWIIAKLARDDGIDPEEALRAANRKFARRFTEMSRSPASAAGNPWPSARSKTWSGPGKKPSAAPPSN